MVDTKDLIKIKEYETYILFQHKKAGYMECFLRVDLASKEKQARANKNKWERKLG